MRRSPPLLLLSFAASCSRTAPGDAASPPVPPAPAPSRAVVPVVAARTELDDRCEAPPSPVIDPSWELRHHLPGPRLLDVVLAMPDVWLASTSHRVCASSDDGRHWSERIAFERGVQPSLARIDETHVLVTGLDATGVLRATRLVSDGVAHELDLPAGPIATVVTDGAGRLYAADAHAIRVSDDLGSHWSSPRALPGSASTDVQACGPLVMVRARIDDEHFFERSDDRGNAWRPFRLGAIGLEQDRAFVRCIAGVGGLEAGRGDVPSHWSWDGGKRWVRAPYATITEPRTARCAAAPTGHAVVCSRAGGVQVFGRGGEPLWELHAPATCDRVRVLDDRTAVAFGATCGLYETRDRGGRWLPRTQSFGDVTAPRVLEGQGGFVALDVAWRIDGGLWWTSDGGVHWTVEPGSSARKLERGVFVDAHRGVFGTSDGRVVTTDDGGASFRFVVHAAAERIAQFGDAIVVTTARTVLVSRDGGQTWHPGGTVPHDRALAPRVEPVGDARELALGSRGTRVREHDGTVTLEHPDGTTVTLARGLGAGTTLLAAFADTRGDVVRVLLAGGIVLVRASQPPLAHPPPA